MTLSLYSSYRAWRRDVAADKATKQAKRGSVTASLYSALALLGTGVDGVYSIDLPDAHAEWPGIG
jgi:hypothetical protein